MSVPFGFVACNEKIQSPGSLLRSEVKTRDCVVKYSPSSPKNFTVTNHIIARYMRLISCLSRLRVLRTSRRGVLGNGPTNNEGAQEKRCPEAMHIMRNQLENKKTSLKKMKGEESMI